MTGQEVPEPSYGSNAEGRIALLGVIGVVAAAIGSSTAVVAAAYERVAFECSGESPDPCTCYRAGTAPTGFMANRSSMGPAPGVQQRVLLTVIASAVCAVTVLVARRVTRRRPGATSRPKMFSILLRVAVILLIAACGLWIWRVEPGPCQDQGALQAFIAPGACRS